MNITFGGSRDAPFWFIVNKMRLRRRTVLVIYLQILIIFLNYKKCNSFEEWSKLRLVQVVSVSSYRSVLNSLKMHKRKMLIRRNHEDVSHRFLVFYP